MDVDNQTSSKPAGAIKLKCAWHKCGKEFEPTQKGQRFCSGGKCKDAHNNWLKKTGVHFIPPIYNYIKSVADSRIPPITVSEMANEMILKVMGRELAELNKNEQPGEYLKTIEGIDE